MALFRWRGDGVAPAVKSDWDDGRNWVDETGTLYVAGTYPGSAATFDDVIFDVALTGTMVSVAGYDAVGALDTMLRSFRVAPAYDGTIGTSAVAPIDIEIAHDTDPETEDCETIIEGNNCGNIFLCGGGTDGLLRVTVLNMKSGSTLALDEKSGTLRILKGTVTLDAGAIVSTELTIGYISAPTTDVTLTIPNATTIPAIVNSYGGQITCYRGVITLNLRGGTWTQDADTAGNYGDITTLRMGGNSPKLAWNVGNIIDAEVYAGILDGSVPCAIGREFTVIKVYPGGKIDLSDALQNNTVAVGGYIQYFGGTVKFGEGQKLLPIP